MQKQEQKQRTDLNIRGVSVYHLEHHFLPLVCQSKNEHGDGMLSRLSKIHEIENLQGLPGVIRQKGTNVVCPVDGKIKAAYVHCLSGSDHVGEATHMISYCWSYSIGNIVDALCDYCETHNLNPKRTYIWICCLCINQHRVVEQKETGGTGMLNFEQEFPLKLKQIGHMLAMLTPWEAPIYLTRLWCIFEFFAAIVNNVPVDIIVPHCEAKRMAVELLGREGIGVDALYAALQNIDIQHAHATMDEDRAKILGLVEDSVGFHEVNQSVGEHFRSWVKGILERLVSSYLGEQEQQSGCGDPLATSSVWARIGKLLAQVGDYNLAIQCYEQALKIREDHLGKGHLETAALYDSMGSVLFHSGQQKKATEMGMKCLAIRQSQLGMDHPTTALSYRSMGLYLTSRGQNDAALSMLQRCQEIQETNSSLAGVGGGLVMAETYSAISTVLQRKRKYTQAVSMQKKALDCMASVSGPDHPRMANAYHSLGSTLLCCGSSHRDEALRFFQKCLEIREIALGNSHPATASTHFSIGHVLQQKGDYEGAVAAFERCRSMQEKYLSPEHPDTALTYSALGIVFGLLGKYNEAMQFHKTAERNLSSSLGGSHPLTLKSRYLALQTLARYLILRRNWNQLCSVCIDWILKIGVWGVLFWMASGSDKVPKFYLYLLGFFVFFLLAIFVAAIRDVINIYWRADRIHAPEMMTMIRAADNDDYRYDNLELGVVVPDEVRDEVPREITVRGA